MKKYLLTLIAGVALFASAQDAPSKKEFKPLAGLSVIGGIQKNKYFKASAPVYGIEFSMECPLIQNEKSRVRQQISMMRQKQNGYRSLTIEINPQYKLITMPSFELGIGPVTGFIFTHIRDNNKPVFNYGLGTSAMYYFRRVFIGLESRYTMTKKIMLDDMYNDTAIAEKASLNSLRGFLKLGYKLHK